MNPERACRAVGIDLGTTYSSLAYMDSQMTPRVVCDSSGQSVMPSVVFFDDQEIIVGEMALAQAKLRAERVVQFIKVHMGDEWRKELCGQVHTPESISGLILSQLVREAEPQIGSIRDAVITVPAFFTERRRRATQQAGEISGLNVIGTLNEPMAASLAYGLYRTDQEQFAVVYDLGGGTFDVTVVRITPNELEELASCGNRQLGGRDWDQALIDHLCNDFQRVHKKDPRESVQALQDLQLECEAAKRRLGRMARTSIRLHVFGRDHSVEVTREKFESLTAHLLQLTKLTTEAAIEDAKLDWSQVARIVLVGGSTHMPAVRKMLKEASGLTPDAGVNPVLAVSLGASIYAHMLETGHSMKAIRCQPLSGVDDEPQGAQAPMSELAFADDGPATVPVVALPNVRFVTAHGVGLKVHAKGHWRNEVLIPKNTPVPVQITKRFRTHGESGRANRVTISITQGDTRDVELAEALGIGRIEGIPPGQPAGSPVDVTMEFDDQGRLHTRAVYVPTGQSMRVSLEVQGGLRGDEVQSYRDMLVKSGIGRPFRVEEAISRIDDFDDDNELPMIEPV